MPLVMYVQVAALSEEYLMLTDFTEASLVHVIVFWLPLAQLSPPSGLVILMVGT